MAPQSARRDRITSEIHSASEHAWVMWIRFANSHTGQRHYARANRPDRWQHPTTAKTRFLLLHLLGRPQMEISAAAAGTAMRLSAIGASRLVIFIGLILIFWLGQGMGISARSAGPLHIRMK